MGWNETNLNCTNLGLVSGIEEHFSSLVNLLDHLPSRKPNFISDKPHGIPITQSQLVIQPSRNGKSGSVAPVKQGFLFFFFWWPNQEWGMSPFKTNLTLLKTKQKQTFPPLANNCISSQIICDMIKGNESNVRNINFELQA